MFNNISTIVVRHSDQTEPRRRNAVTGVDLGMVAGKSEGEGKATEELEEDVSLQDSKISSQLSASGRLLTLWKLITSRMLSLPQPAGSSEESRDQAYEEQRRLREQSVYWYATDGKVDTFFRDPTVVPFSIRVRQRQHFGDWCDRFSTEPSKVLIDVDDPIVTPPAGQTWKSIEDAKQSAGVISWEEEKIRHVPFSMPTRRPEIRPKLRKVGQRLRSRKVVGRRRGKDDVPESVEMMSIRRPDAQEKHSS